MRTYKPKPENIDDAAILQDASATLRKVWMDLEQIAKKAKTSAAEGAFSVALELITGALVNMQNAALTLEENALQDAIDDDVDRAYDNSRD